MNRDIVFSHVHFRYGENAPEILQDINMTIRAGTTVGILGATGSGKSTLVQILDRLWDLPPEWGTITIGGVDIREIDRGWLRRNIGMVLQEPYLFSRTLAENIAIAMPPREHPDPDYTLESASESASGNPPRDTASTSGTSNRSDLDGEPSDENAGTPPQESGLPPETEAVLDAEYEMAEIRRAAEIACLDEAIEKFSDGYDTFVGERGVTLSGGQKQRAAMAQMLVRRTPIMIFDDSLSAVDAETDVRIRRSLLENTAGATVILIAHRITTLQHADEIFVLDQGGIAEHGTHDELIARGGLYSRVHELQTGAEACG